MKARTTVPLLAILALGLPGCGGDDDADKPGGQTPGGQTEAEAAFQACLATVKPTCIVSELNTAEKMETACGDLTMIPIPLTDGSTYGPKTIKGGPYGGISMWNEGAGTEFVNPVHNNEPACLQVGVQSFRQPDSVNAEILNVRSIDYSLYTIFRPACMKQGETYPVITWANGTCGLTHGYGVLLGTLASYGFVIIASNSTWTATPPTNRVQLRALDYAKFLNEDPNSIYYGKLNLDRIGAMGHSQGAGATVAASSDPRVKSLILWNGATNNNKPFLYVSGEQDIGIGGQPPTAASLADATGKATQPGAWVYHHKILATGGSNTGHLVLMEQPERVVELAVAWWKYQLNGDEQAKKMFLGEGCGFCNSKAEFDYGHNSLLQ
jgi:hypothetical protein